MNIKVSITSSVDGVAFIRYDATVELDKGTSLEQAEATLRSVVSVLDDQLGDSWGEDEDDDAEKKHA